MSREAMKRIKTWSERCEEHPDHQQGMISEGMIRARMQEEIDELRQALVDADDISEKRVDEKAKREHEWVGLTDEEIMEPWPFENRIAFARWLESKLKEKNHG